MDTDVLALGGPRARQGGKLPTRGARGQAREKIHRYGGELPIRPARAHAWEKSTVGEAESSAPRTKLPFMLGVIAGLTAGIVVLAGGGDAFWVCLPGALLVAGSAPGRVSGLVRAAVVALAAALPPLVSSDLSPLPSPPLAAAVIAASLAVLLALRARLERERDSLRRSALSDPLTGIANRRSLMARIDYEISRHARARHSFALVLIDLDGFKALNDRFGHTAGDDLLRETASALRRTVRAQDTAARIGGDEFCVLAPETHAAGTAQLESRINQAVAGLTAGVTALSASAGSAMFPRDGTSAAELMAAADARLLAAKRQLPRDRDQRHAA